jgi:hypothetical protein
VSDRYSERAGFLMGNPDREQSQGLTVLSIGGADTAATTALEVFAPLLHIRDVTLPAQARLEEHPEAVNRAIDAAPSHWILIIRSGEVIDAALAREIAASAVEPPVAWGFRIQTRVSYRGEVLRIGRARGGGEVRLIHRRHARFDLRARGSEIKVQGTVLRLKSVLQRQTYASAREHQQALRSERVPHSALRHVLVFFRRAAGSGSLWPGLNTLRYLWIESAYDSGGDPRPGG